MSQDSFAHWDGAYVLGALDTNERRLFEEHLSTCGQCARSVRELAGLPGLLSRLDGEDFDAADETPEVPQTLLPSMLREVRREQRRRLRNRLGFAAAAVVVAATGVGVYVQTRPDTPESSETAVGEPGQPMAQVDQDVLSASLLLESVRWGTRVQLTCSYKASDAGPSEPPAYALVLRTRDGRTEQVATWRAVFGRTTTIVGATAEDAGDIRSVEVQTVTGRRVLELKS